MTGLTGHHGSGAVTLPEARRGLRTLVRSVSELEQERLLASTQ